jgi:hypothetical protein
LVGALCFIVAHITPRADQTPWHLLFIYSLHTRSEYLRVDCDPA